MSPTFLLSFDCEGKWGFADKLAPGDEQQLTRSALTEIYRRLLECLDRHGIRASFAFVGALTLAPDQALEHQDWFDDGPPELRSWLRRFHTDWRGGRTEGWLEPQLLALVRGHPQHEIASHGFSHLPLSHDWSSREVVRRELQNSQAVAQLHGLPLRTLIYPRNLSGYEDELPRFEFTGYRQGHARIPRLHQRLGNLARELWPGMRAEHHPSTRARPIAIPAGQFMNWRQGARRHVPFTLTVDRWRRALEDASQHGGVVHLWSHPHNFLTGHRQLALLDAILDMVTTRLGRGELQNLTLGQYSHARLAESGDGLG